MQELEFNLNLLMATRPDIDDDDGFSQLYKEYTGPLGSNVSKSSNNDTFKTNYKKSLPGSDEDEEPRDPNAVPTDFTSREAKVWEAKSKATERNWKKRKEEEMICKICGESGHFTQGCPSTLGASRKSQDFFERVPARDKHIKALFTEKVVQRIENEIGCKLKMEEKFLIVSGKDRLILKKGSDAVHKVIRGEGDQKGSSSSYRSRSRSPERSPVVSRFRRSESERSYPSHPRDTHQNQQRFGVPDQIVENSVHEDLHKFPRGSPQARAYGYDRGRSCSSHSRSPARPPYSGNSYGSFDGHNHSVNYRNDVWETERRGPDLHSAHQFEHSTFPQTLEELEVEFQREATELGRICDKEEDEENTKHREIIRDMRETHFKKYSVLRDSHKRQWKEFLQLVAQRRQQQARQQMPSSVFSSYKHTSYSDYDGPSANSHYSGAGLSMDSRTRYSSHVENHPSRPHDNYGEFQRQRRDDFGKTYNRY